MELAYEGLITIEDFSRMDLRVGVILSVEEVPKSKKLLHLRVDFGEVLGTKTVMAGVKAAAPVVGQRVLAVVNLPPRMMAEVMSEAMLLATHCANGILTLATIAADAEAGAKLG